MRGIVEEGQVDRSVLSKASVCDHCRVTRPFDRLVRRRKDWSKGPAGVDMYTAVALLAVAADRSIFVCVFLHWRAMTGTVVQLSSRLLRCDWLPVTGHGGSCHRESCAAMSVRALFCGKGHKGITSQTSLCWTLCSSTSHKHNMLWPYQYHWYLGIITLYWYTEVNGIMLKEVLDTEIESIYLWHPGVIHCMCLSIATETAFRLVWTLRPSIYIFSSGTLISCWTS